MPRGQAITARPFVAYDLTRLFLAPVHVTPRGIDRVDLGYARHFFQDWRGDAVATLLTPFGVRVMGRTAALRIVHHAEELWSEYCNPGDDPLLERVKRKLCDHARGPGVIQQRKRQRQVVSMTRQFLRHARTLVRTSDARAIAQNGIYLNTGQMGIAIPRFLSWLKRRPDIRPVFMLHDLIPIQHAQFVPPLSSYFFNNMVVNTAVHAAGLITTTNAMGSAIRQELSRRGRPRLPVVSVPLPVSPRFADGRSFDSRLAGVPYFVIVGSIEPRKNHALLLDVWRELVKTEGERAPKLVIAGTRWHGHEAVTDVIKRTSELSGTMIEVGGLSTPALHQLMSNARGLLMPSLAEGFGLPIIEALALGVPVIASDIAAHREAGGSGAIYLDADDCTGWAAAIRRLMMEEQGQASPGLVRTWADYFNRIDPFLASIADSERFSVEEMQADLRRVEVDAA
jgi:glycosyltransferase involved in cell wall biosynthesis